MLKAHLFKIVVLFLVLVLGELAVRIFVFNEYTNSTLDYQDKRMFDYGLGKVFANHEYLPFSLLPGKYDLGESKILSINAAGFRGDEIDFSLAKKRILFLGDSYVYGFGLDDQETLPRRTLEALEVGTEWEMINAGFKGSNPSQYALFLQNELPKLPVDFLIINLLSDNDLTDLNYNFIETRDANGRAVKICDGLVSYNGRRYREDIWPPLVELPILKKSAIWFTLLRTYYRWFVSKRAQTTGLEEQKQFFAQGVNDIAMLLREKNIPFVFSLMPGGLTLREGAAKNESYLWIKQFLTERRFEYIDLGEIIFKQDPAKLKIKFNNETGAYEDLHFNAYANKVIGKFLAGKIEPRLRDL